VLRPPVQQQQRRPAPRLGDMDAQPPGLDVPVRHIRDLRHRPVGPLPGPCRDLAGALLCSHRPAFPLVLVVTREGAAARQKVPGDVL